jgi:DNA polymerase III delta prime subunit|tara:strand:- start:1005 stop:1988 length:984 start_codon:yes stop_codon:yes gene_type:complete
MNPKFYETHFDEYLSAYDKLNLHPKLLKDVLSKMPDDMNNMPNIIFYGAKGIGKYTQVLSILKKYSPSNLKYEKKLQINYQGKQLYYKISDIHIEVDMGLLGCNAKLLWNELYYQLIDIACTKSNKHLIVVCKNFQEIHNELLENFYSYMQIANYLSIKLTYLIITEEITFIPDNIINISKVISMSRPNKTLYKKCIPNVMSQNINDIINIKNIKSNITQLTNPHEITCNKLLDIMYNTKINYSYIREVCYDIFIYHLDIYECVWYILKTIIKQQKIEKDLIYKILIKTYVFFKYYNNNYRPIYHLENYVLYLISIIHGYDKNNKCV